MIVNLTLEKIETIKEDIEVKAKFTHFLDDLKNEYGN